MVAANPTSPLHPLHSIECHPACTVYPACTERSRSEPRREPSRSERSEGSAFDFSPVSVSASSSLSSSFNFKLSTACPEARRRVSFLSLSPFLATLTKNTGGWVPIAPLPRRPSYFISPASSLGTAPYAQQRPQILSTHRFTSRFSGYRGGGYRGRQC